MLCDNLEGLDGLEGVKKVQEKEDVCMLCCAKSLQTLCDPLDCSPQGSSVHGILQARILELVAMPASRGSS